MTSAAVVWHESLDEGGDHGRTSAWIFSLAGAGRFTRLAPTARDLRDLGVRHGEDARRFLGRRAALRHLIARWCSSDADAVEVGYDPAGRPVVRSHEPGPFCSVSARGDLTALALSTNPVGVDLEPLDIGDIPWAVLAEEEAARLRMLGGTTQLVAFLELWTVKEAFLKARGSGLLFDPAGIAVSTERGTIRDHEVRRPLHPSALRKCQVAGRELVAACVTWTDATSGT